MGRGRTSPTETTTEAPHRVTPHDPEGVDRLLWVALAGALTQFLRRARAILAMNMGRRVRAAGGTSRARLLVLTVSSARV